MSRTLRTAFTTLTIALALTACGPTQNEDTTQAADEAPKAPVTTEAPITTEAAAPEAPADTPEAPAPEAPADQPIPAVAPTPTTPPVPEHRPCSIDQAPDGGYYAVTGIKEDDKHGGLTARAYAGYSYGQLGLLLNGAVVQTYIDDAALPSCLVTADNNVWWEIYTETLGGGLWVNARYLTFPEIEPDYHGDEEADAHGDCIFLPDLPETCMVIFWQDGEIVEIDVTQDEYLEIQYACIYQGFESACDVLAFEGQDIIAPFAYLDDAELSDLCQTGTALEQKLACAEVQARATI